MKDKRLGRGLDFLLNLSSQDIQDTNKIENVDLRLIRKNRFQPRETINEESFKELVESIKDHGVLQPILLRRDGDSYEIIAGERRFKACKELGKEKIPAVVLDISEEKLLELALVENIQRENLTPIEEARAYQTMIRLENLTQEVVAKRLGKKRSTITNTIRLLDLPEEIQDDVSRGTITFGHARALLGFNSKKEMYDTYKKILSSRISVREVESLSHKGRSNKKQHPQKNHSLSPYEETLKERFGTKVLINSKGDKGSIQFNFYSMDDFTRLYKLLTSIS